MRATGIALERAPDRSRLSWQLRLKGALDRLLAVTALLFDWPLLLALAGLVRLSSPGPALYRQTRLGRHGESIEVLKSLWRTPGAEFHGRHFDFGPTTCNPRPRNPNGVPIVIGGYALATARRAGRIGDAHYPGPASPSDVERFRVEIERTALEHGRDPAAIESIVAAPYDRPLDIDLCSRYAAAGVAEIVISLPVSGDDRDSMRRALETFRAALIEPVGVG